MINQTWDYGDLRVTLTSTYGWNWDDTGNGTKQSIMAWTPQAQGNMRPLGSVAIPSGFYELGGNRASLLVGNNPNSTGSRPAVASPIRWVWLWNPKGQGGEHDGTFWRPVAPDGYVALGDVCKYRWDQPDLNSIWCLRADLTKDGQFDDKYVWDDRGSGGDWDCSVWKTVPKGVGASGSEQIPIFADTFRVNTAYSKPDVSLATVPSLKLSKDFHRFVAPLPKITPSTIPSKGDVFDEIEQCHITLPFTAFFDPTDRRSLDNIRKPFCTLSKSIAWNAEGVWVNNAAGAFSRSETVKYGVSKQQTQEMIHSVGVEISSEVGIKAVTFSVSLNYQFTYSTSSSYTEFSEKEVKEDFNVPAYHVTVLFSKHVWLVGKRSDGSELCRIQIAANDDVHFSGCDFPH